MLLLINNNNNGDGTKEIVESENKSDSDSARYSRNSTQRPGKKPEGSRNNDKCRVSSDNCTPRNSTHTLKVLESS